MIPDYTDYTSSRYQTLLTICAVFPSSVSKGNPVVIKSVHFICVYIYIQYLYFRLNSSRNNYYLRSYIILYTHILEGILLRDFFIALIFFFSTATSTDVKIRRQQTRKLLSLRVNLFRAKDIWTTRVKWLYVGIIYFFYFRCVCVYICMVERGEMREGSIAAAVT